MYNKWISVHCSTRLCLVEWYVWSLNFWKLLYSLYHDKLHHLITFFFIPEQKIHSLSNGSHATWKKPNFTAEILTISVTTWQYCIKSCHQAQGKFWSECQPPWCCGCMTLPSPKHPSPPSPARGGTPRTPRSRSWSSPGTGGGSRSAAPGSLWGPCTSGDRSRTRTVRQRGLREPETKSANRRLRARRALTLFNDVPLRTRRALAL